MKSVIIIAIAVIFVTGLGLSINVSAEENEIPSWIKKSAEWWIDGSIGDADFLKTIEYLLTNDIIRIPSQEESTINDKSTINEELYKTYVSKQDNYLIRIPSIWLITDSGIDDVSLYAVNMDLQKNTEPEQLLAGIASTNVNELDDFMRDSYMPYLERTATDLEIIKSDWTKKYRDVPFGAKITYEYRQGQTTYLSTIDFTLERNIVYYVQHIIPSSQESSINLDYIFNSFEIGFAVDYNGVEFGVGVKETLSSPNTEFSNITCPSGTNIVKYEMSNTYRHFADKNGDGYYCIYVSSSAQETFHDNY